MAGLENSCPNCDRVPRRTAACVPPHREMGTRGSRLVSVGFFRGTAQSGRSSDSIRSAYAVAIVRRSNGIGRGWAAVRHAGDLGAPAPQILIRQSPLSLVEPFSDLGTRQGVGYESDWAVIVEGPTCRWN